MVLPLTDAALPLVGVSTTDVFCRPGCPARAPRPDHVERFATAHEALFAGYRPCRRCRPMEGWGRDVTPAQLRRAAALHPTLAAARRARARRSGRDAVVVRQLPTPLGPVLAGAVDDGICLLEFTDRPMLPTQLAVLRHRLGHGVVAGSHPHLDRLAEQLGEWFAAARTTFDLPLVAPGTPFQERVWAVLRSLPPGTTISYEELAARAGRPGAQRAAGTANGANRLAILVPCHRVVRKSGEIGNYGGGRWRKEWLLRHEAEPHSLSAAHGAGVTGSA
jgi:AraC family transcriptional regulator of adaptative response/methylated-DNA-[protein]-cysteine methyltransferase